MPKSKSKKKTGGVMSRITVPQFLTAAASLGNRFTNLAEETWRLNENTRKTTSLWSYVANQLKLDETEEIRHCLYNLLHRNEDYLKKRIERALKQGVNTFEANDDNACELNEIDNNLNLHPEPSIPLPERLDTRAQKESRTNNNNNNNNADNGGDNNNENNNNNHSSNQTEMSFILSVEEWRNAYSYRDIKLKREWRNIFYNKLKSACGVTCELYFRTNHIKKGERKWRCNYFRFEAFCTGSNCTRKIEVMLKEEVDIGASPIFRVKLSGKVNHDPNVETMSRQLRGEERRRVGKRVNEIGPTAVYRERLEAADERLLAEGNYTEVNTIEVTKKTGDDYRRLYRLDEDIYRECRVSASSLRSADTDSVNIQGYIQVVGELPFRIHLFSEQQIDQYADYCKKEKYSFVHIDATSGVIKRLKDQGPPLLYAMLIKTGDDATQNIPIAHAILTDNTVPSINYFLGTIAHSITEHRNKLILPSFFVIDFSAALMNSILQSFNAENINTHLARCWNVIGKTYNRSQLRSLSFIHLCCCHVIHAIARSLTQANVDKKIRKSLLYVFALILCGNDLEQLYDLLGQLIEIFGDPNEQNAKVKLDQLLSWELNVDEKSATMLQNGDIILIDAEQNDNFKLVDEYLRSSTPIIHQSPFNIEAIRRYPCLKDLLNDKSKVNNNVNALFSRPLIRVIYRWWAYLPLWTGLLWNFKERYANDVQGNVKLSYHPLRYSNAVLESYFRTYKTSVLQKKSKNSPRELIEATYRSIKVQLKGLKYGITQSSKGRKRRKKNKTPVETHKKGVGQAHRAIYVGVIDNATRLNEQKRRKDQQLDTETMQDSEPEEENMLLSSSTESSATSNRLDVNVDPIENIESLQNSPASSLSTVPSEVSDEFPMNVANNLDEPNADDQQSDASSEFDFNENQNMSSIVDTLYKINKEQRAMNNRALYQSDALIDGQVYLWPKFGIKNAIFNGQSYNLSMTCSIDSVLFSLYLIYHTDANVAEEFRAAPSQSPYSVLVETFRIVESDGWDQARIHWLLEFGIINPTASGTVSLFGMLSQTIIKFLEQEQRYSSTATCSRDDCPKSRETFTSTKIDLFPNETEFPKFKVDSHSVCATVVKNFHDITENEAKAQKYEKGWHEIFDQSTNTKKKIEVWLCNRDKYISAASFPNGYPPILIAEIKPSISKRRDEGYAQTDARLRDMKTIIKIGDVQYKLRAALHYKQSHFTATFIGGDNDYYHFDDMTGVREGRACTDLVEYGIYTRIFTF